MEGGECDISETVNDYMSITVMNSPMMAISMNNCHYGSCAFQNTKSSPPVLHRAMLPMAIIHHVWGIFPYIPPPLLLGVLAQKLRDIQ